MWPADARELLYRILVGLTLLLPCSCLADGCTLTQLSQLTPTFGEEDRLIVEGSYNSKPIRVLLDFDTPFTEIGDATARSLALPRSYGSLLVREHVGESSDAQFATFSSFLLGTVHFYNLEASVINDATSPNVIRDSMFGVDIRIGARAAEQFDYEFDLAHRTIRIFSSDHCDGKVVYWAPDYLVLPFSVSIGGKFMVEAIVNGNAAHARLALGWGHTVVNERSMSKLGLAARPIILDTLEFGGLKFHHVAVATIKPITGITSAESHITGPAPEDAPDIWIGDDIFQRLRIYIANKESKAYFTLATTH